jgi:hypothetical protein
MVMHACSGESPALRDIAKSFGLRVMLHLIMGVSAQTACVDIYKRSYYPKRYDNGAHLCCTSRVTSRFKIWVYGYVYRMQRRNSEYKILIGTGVKVIVKGTRSFTGTRWQYKY